MKTRIVRTNADNKDFVDLTKLLDKELVEKDGDEHSFYSQFNTIDKIKFVVVLYKDDEAIGCGAIKEFSPGIMEIKRMFTMPANRENGIASKVLSELETWAAELTYKKCILETGKRQTEALLLYKKRGFRQIENYGPYTQVENSVCFEKLL